MYRILFDCCYVSFLNYWLCCGFCNLLLFGSYSNNARLLCSKIIMQGSRNLFLRVFSNHSLKGSLNVNNRKYARYQSYEWLCYNVFSFINLHTLLYRKFELLEYLERDDIDSIFSRNVIESCDCLLPVRCDSSFTPRLLKQLHYVFLFSFRIIRVLIEFT